MCKRMTAITERARNTSIPADRMGELRAVIPFDYTISHYERGVLERMNVFERIAGHGAEVPLRIDGRHQMRMHIHESGQYGLT